MFYSFLRLLYAVNLACTTICVYFFTKFMALTLGWCTSKNFREQVCLICTQTAWWISLRTSPWIRNSCTPETAANLAKIATQIKENDSSFMVIANHTSFFDTCI